MKCRTRFSPSLRSSQSWPVPACLSLCPLAVRPPSPAAPQLCSRAALDFSNFFNLETKRSIIDLSHAILHATPHSSRIHTMADSTKTPESFADLGIDRWLVDSLGAMAIRKPTPIQAACIQPILEGISFPPLSPPSQLTTVPLCRQRLHRRLPHRLRQNHRLRRPHPAPLVRRPHRHLRTHPHAHARTRPPDRRTAHRARRAPEPQSLPPHRRH